MSRTLSEKFYIGLLALVTSMTIQASCPPLGLTRNDLVSIKQNKFEVPTSVDIQTLAVSMTACLANKDPVLRDEIAFSALQNWMRSKRLSKITVHKLYENLSKTLLSTHASKAGFVEPFSALTLSEVARYDRNDETLSNEERSSLVNTAVRYMNSIHDYRGFDAKQGYRHGVAHTADLMLQLSLNPALEKNQLDQMLSALSNKIRVTDEHSYVYGEPTRLMVSVFYIAKRKLHSEAEWKAWFATIASPKPEAKWDGALKSQAGWSRKHNAEAFLLAMYVNVNESNNKEMQTLLMPAIMDALKLMP